MQDAQLQQVCKGGEGQASGNGRLRMAEHEGRLGCGHASVETEGALRRRSISQQQKRMFQKQRP